MSDPAAGEDRQSFRERITVEGQQLAEKVAELIHEGNVRHIVIKHDGHTIFEVPITLGAVAAVIAPTLAAVAAVGALVAHCTVEITRADPEPPSPPSPPPAP